MAQLQNKDILNAIRDEQSAEYQNNIPVATGLNDLEVYASLEAYPTAKNEFINTLTNRIGRQIFFDKVFSSSFFILACLFFLSVNCSWIKYTKIVAASARNIKK